MKTAAKVRKEKAAHPERFCPSPRCLWRRLTRDGVKPCPKHPHGWRLSPPTPESR